MGPKFVVCGPVVRGGTRLATGDWRLAIFWRLRTWRRDTKTRANNTSNYPVIITTLRQDEFLNLDAKGLSFEFLRDTRIHSPTAFKAQVTCGMAK